MCKCIVHFGMPFLCRLETTTSSDQIQGFMEKLWTQEGRFSYLFLNLKAAPTISVPGYVSNTKQIKLFGIIAS